MDSLNELLAELRAVGVTLWHDNGQLAYRAPRGALKPELLSQLRARKPELLERLRLAASAPAVPPIARASRSAPLALSSAQERLWFLDQAEGTNPAFNVLGALRLEGSLDCAALERSLNEIVRRHEVLRTTFSLAANLGTGDAATLGPRQVIHPHAPFGLSVVEVSGNSPAELAAAEQRYLAAEVNRYFDLKTGPLYHFTLLRLQEGFAAPPRARAGADRSGAASSYDLLVNFHHIVVDGWSIHVFFQELAALYAAFCQGGVSPLPELARQYADYAQFERSWIDSPAAASAKAYWRAQLSGLPSIRIPADHPPPLHRSYAGLHHTQRLPGTLVGALRQLSLRQGVTPFMTLGAAVGCLLHYYTGAAEVVLGTNVANREEPQLQPLIGFFTNQLVLRLCLSETQSLAHILACFREAALAAQAHQRYPIQLCAAELSSTREEGLATPFHVKFEYVEQRSLALTLPGLAVSPIAVPLTQTRDTLGILIGDDAQSMQLEISARRDLYTSASILRLTQLFTALLEQLVVAPEQTLASVCLFLTQTDQQRQRQRAEAARAEVHQKLKVRRRASSIDPDGRGTSDP